jgi:signal transduction histidine kinase
MAVACLPSSPRAAYSPRVGLRDLAIGVRAAGGVRGVRGRVHGRGNAGSSRRTGAGGADARRRVQQERLRIARELHDAVDHQVALISVQAGGMGYLLDTDLAKARESLAHIQRASEAALKELRLTVGLLRQPGDHEPVDPVGGLARL